MTFPPPPNQPPKGGDGTLIAGMAVTGAALFIVLNAIFGFLVFIVASENSSGTSNTANSVIFGVGAVLCALVAFGGGSALILVRKPIPKGIGMGLMIGWALVTVCTVGFCTGLNPALYDSF